MGVLKNINTPAYIYPALLGLGAMSALSMAPTSWWFMLFMGFSGFYVLLSKTTSVRAGFLKGLVFSFGYFAISLSWIGNALLVGDAPYKWAYPLAVCALPLCLSLFTATAGAVFVATTRARHVLIKYTAFIALMALSEIARGHLFTGFPWNLYGYTWINVPQIAQFVAVTDSYALSVMTIFWASTVGFIAADQSHATLKTGVLSLSLLSMVAIYIWGDSRLIHDDNTTAQASAVTATIIQPNIPQDEKWLPEKRLENFQKHIDLTIDAAHTIDRNADTPHIIIWPETATTQMYIQSEIGLNLFRDALSYYPANTTLATGVLRYDGETQEYFNSIVILNKDAEIIDIYDKSHLVPFGEYIPFGDILNAQSLVGFTGFGRGDAPQNITISDTYSLLPLICYEIIFPSKLDKDVTASANFIVNVTNDGWYGDSAGPRQHLVSAQFRAIETGTPILRSANTGISALISPQGKIIQSISLLKSGFFTQKIPNSIDYAR